MKKYLLAGFILASASVFTSHAQVKTSVQEVATPELAKQREELKTRIISSYLAMKNSLVISDVQKTATSAKELAAALSVFKFKKLNLEDMNASTTTRESIKKLAQHMAESTSVNEQRKDMETLSVQLWSIIDRVKPADFVVYQQKCPMMGTTWLSDSKKIENPYYPKNMLTCGEVIAEK